MYALAFIALTAGSDPDPQAVAALALAAAARPAACECGCADGKTCSCADCPMHPKPAVPLALASVQDESARVTALEARVTALERQVMNQPAGTAPAANVATGPPRPQGDGWTLDQTRAVWWRPQPADAVQANVAQMGGYPGFTGIPAVRTTFGTGFTSFGDDGGGGACVQNADGSMSCGAGAGFGGGPVRRFFGRWRR